MADGLRLERLTAYYGPVAAVQEASLLTARGSTVGLIGANGAGKSTLLKAIAGLVRSSGSIELEGKPIGQLSTPRRYALGLAFVPQERMIIGALTVRENLRLSWLAGRRLTPFEDQIRQVVTLFPQLALRLDTLAVNLSGGQRQMLAISRGLATSPAVLLLDEPMAGLAPVLVAELSEALARLRDGGLTMLLVEQNVRVATRLCETINVMAGGRIVWQGQASQVGREVATQLYLGGDAAAPAS